MIKLSRIVLLITLVLVGCSKEVLEISDEDNELNGYSLVDESNNVKLYKSSSFREEPVDEYYVFDYKYEVFYYTETGIRSDYKVLLHDTVYDLLDVPVEYLMSFDELGIRSTLEVDCRYSNTFTVCFDDFVYYKSYNGVFVYLRDPWIEIPHDHSIIYTDDVHTVYFYTEVMGNLLVLQNGEEITLTNLYEQFGRYGFSKLGLILLISYN